MSAAPTAQSQSMAGQDQRIGLFIGSWQIGTQQPGAATLKIHCTFDAPSGAVHGLGQLTQATNPPLDMASRLDGDFTYLTVMPDSSHVLVTLTGYPITQWPSHGGTGPVMLPNLSLRMLLASDWQTGTASMRYLLPNGSWQLVESAPVQFMSNVTLAGKP